MGAHPRSRGENSSWPRIGPCAPGSSPLTRGKRELRQLQARNRGLIPAHAGKTWSSRKVARPIRAHPRSRGENFGQKTNDPGAKGSSPLTRGKHARGVDRVNDEGLIPAHAGKTPDASRSVCMARAHPRSRGENRAFTNACSVVLGSSPLTRGKPCARGSGRVEIGLIPAHAGKTGCRRRRPSRGRAHPRSRGENRLAGRWLLRGLGSSPLTRGKRFKVVAGRGRRGLIPAHAGKTCVRGMGLGPFRAHPRSRGENAIQVFKAA